MQLHDMTESRATKISMNKSKNKNSNNIYNRQSKQIKLLRPIETQKIFRIKEAEMISPLVRIHGEGLKHSNQTRKQTTTKSFIKIKTFQATWFTSKATLCFAIAFWTSSYTDVLCMAIPQKIANAWKEICWWDKTGWARLVGIDGLQPIP